GAPAEDDRVAVVPSRAQEVAAARATVDAHRVPRPFGFVHSPRVRVGTRDADRRWSARGPRGRRDASAATEIDDRTRGRSAGAKSVDDLRDGEEVERPVKRREG